MAISVYVKIKERAYDNKLPYATARKDRVVNAAYHTEEDRLFQLFRSDLEAEFGTTGHPKANLLFLKAWQKGHSSGYSGVYQWYAELTELVR